MQTISSSSNDHPFVERMLDEFPGHQLITQESSSPNFNYCAFSAKFQQDFIEVCRSDTTHLIIDCSFKYCPRDCKALLSGILYSYDKESALIIFTAILKDISQITFNSAINQLKILFSQLSFSPTFITCPFLFSVTQIFTKSIFIPSFYYYAQALCKLAYQTDIHSELGYGFHVFLFQLLSFSFKSKKTIKAEYNQLMNKHKSNRCVNQFMRHFTYQFIEGHYPATEWRFDKKKSKKLSISRITMANDLIKYHLLIAEKVWNTSVEEMQESEIGERITKQYVKLLVEQLKIPNETDKLFEHLKKMLNNEDITYIPFEEKEYLIGVSFEREAILFKAFNEEGKEEDKITKLKKSLTSFFDKRMNSHKKVGTEEDKTSSGSTSGEFHKDSSVI